MAFFNELPFSRPQKDPSPQKSTPPKTDKKVIRDYDLDKTWKKDPKVRSEIRKILHLENPKRPSDYITSKEIDDKAEQLQSQIDKNKDKYYTPSEIDVALRERSWKVAKELRENAGNISKIKKIKAEDKLLKDTFKKK